VDAKDYKQIIKRPMDLAMIERRNKNFQYTDEKTFLEDFELMNLNAHTYCEGKFDYIVAAADVVLEFVRTEVGKIVERIHEIKAGPTTPMTPRPGGHGGGKKKKFGDEFGEDLLTPGSEGSPGSALSQTGYMGSGDDTPIFDKQLNME
jgi:hypothetical protein